MPRPWLDWAIAAALTALGVAMTDGTLVVAAVTLPVIWRRSAPFAAAVAVAVGLVVSGIPTFDQTRCGVAIPAALLIVFSLAARRDRSAALAGLALVLAGMVVLAAHRSAARRRRLVRPAAVRRRLVGRPPRAIARTA